MPSVLLGWELGAGYGHVAALLQVADSLASRGFEPVLAVRDLRGPWPLLRECAFPVLAAPRLTPAGDPSFSARSFDDVLAASGFADERSLASALRGWDDLLELVRPSLVVTNHAPTLSLAAHGVVATVITGTGFTVPPGDEATFPALVAGRPQAIATGLDAVVQAVLADRGRTRPDSLTALYRRDAYALTVPELDPYAPVRKTPAGGPLRRLPDVLPPPAGGRFFAYLAADAAWAEPALLEMARVARGEVHLRGADAATTGRLEAAGLRVWEHAPPLLEVLAAASVVVHHGSHATAQATLAMGRPQLCLPRHLEQSLTGHLLEQLGAGRCLRGEVPTGAPAEALAALLTEPATTSAGAAAALLAARQDPPALDALVDRCVDLAGGATYF